MRCFVILIALLIPLRLIMQSFRGCGWSKIIPPSPEGQGGVQILHMLEGVALKTMFKIGLTIAVALTSVPL